jgi:hypothetical protein
MDLALVWEIDEGPPTKYMTRTTTDHPPDNGYYLPHHGLIKDKSQTTKLRAVFDGYAPSATGVPFNDISWTDDGDADYEVDNVPLMQRPVGRVITFILAPTASFGWPQFVRQ